jgi:WD40 repeat protein
VLETSDYLVTYVVVCSTWNGTDTDDPASPDDTKIACVTLDGFRYLWQNSDGALLERRKVHSGSVEGLAWHGGTGTVASCAADCTMVVSRLKF